VEVDWFFETGETSQPLEEVFNVNAVETIYEEIQRTNCF
jgi:hypothetical protein